MVGCVFLLANECTIKVQCLTITLTKHNNLTSVDWDIFNKIEVTNKNVDHQNWDADWWAVNNFIYNMKAVTRIPFFYTTMN